MRERWTRTTPVLKVEADEAEALVRPVLGDCRVLRVEPLGGGHSNTNLRVHLDGSPNPVVLRLYQRDPTQAAKEAAIAALVAATVPFRAICISVSGHRTVRPTPSSSGSKASHSSSSPRERMNRSSRAWATR